MPSTPLHSRANGETTDSYTTAQSSFVPDMQSTPARPSGSKTNPRVRTPYTRSNENDTPRTKTNRARTSRLSTSSRPGAKDFATIINPGHMSVSRPAPMTDLAKFILTEGRLPPTPPLPNCWNKDHDRAICVMDLKCPQKSLPDHIQQLRKSFPELRAATITPAMVDRRLQQLDMDIGVNYWSEALKAKDERRKDSSVALVSESPASARKVASKMAVEPRLRVGRKQPSTEAVYMSLTDCPHTRLHRPAVYSNLPQQQIYPRAYQ